MATIKKPMKKAQSGVKATKDSTDYFKKMQDFNYKQAETFAKYGLRNAAEESMNKASQTIKDQFRQKNKGKAGYDKNGYPLKKKMKMGGAVKAKSGKSFPDLNKDGKITKADILKGRGVIAKKGAKVKASGMKKCKYGCK
jgi:hypothetical protein